MGAVSVSQILITPLKRIHVNGGDVLHIMKRSDTGYVDFGEAYFSIVESGAVKGWKRHLSMTLNLVVPLGSVNYVFVDENGETREELVNEDRYVDSIPPKFGLDLRASTLLTVF